MKTVFGILLMVGGIAFGVWLCIWVMLYGGIMQAVENWGVSNSAVVWGIIRAVLCRFGLIPGWLIAWTGAEVVAL